jgi:hypothetical protein
VFRVREPDPASPARETAPAERLLLAYPDAPHDAECLMVHPRTGDIYIVTKARGSDAATAVFKAAAPVETGRLNQLRRVAAIDLPDASVFTLLTGRVTGGDISPDGRRAVLCDYFGAWEAVLPAGARDFDAIWRSPWRAVDLGSRRQGEAVAYRHDGKALLATSEGSPFPLIEVPIK